MSMLWLLPPMVLLAGMAALLSLLRSTDTIAVQIQRRLSELAEVRHAVVVVQAETAGARASLDDLQHR